MDNNLKHLKWKKQCETNGFYAEPYGLAYNYLIDIAAQKIKLSVVDSNYEYIPGYPQLSSSIEDAKSKADKHYNKVIQKILA